ncbi:MAG: sigma-70 family RNA polymerase sigma factor [Chloroflexota bacterium]
MQVIPLSVRGHPADVDRPLDEDDEAALAARERPMAFAPVYERHRDAVWRYLRARCRSEDDAVELTAVTFERALSAVHGYSPRGAGMRAWLVRIARNAAIDHDRRGRALAASAAVLDAQRDPHPTPDEALLASDERELLMARLRALPSAQRDAIALRFGAGMTAREIGAVLGKGEEATQKTISRGLARLREAYRDDH